MNPLIILAGLVTAPIVMTGYLGFQVYAIWRVCTLGVRSYYGTSSLKDDPSWIRTFAISLTVAMSAAFLLGLRGPTNNKRVGSVSRYMFRISNYNFGAVVLLFTACAIYEVIARIVYVKSNHAKTLYFGEGAKLSFFLIVVTWVSTMILGVLNVAALRVENITIESPKIKQRVRITHISDIHMGSRGRQVMENIVKTVNKQNPDLVAITGDLFDIKPVIPEHFRAFKDLTCPAYYVLGNHEHLACNMDGIKKIHEWFKDNVTMLVDEKVDLSGKMDGIEIIGVDDVPNTAVLTEKYNKIPRDDSKFRVLLSHRPSPLASTVPNSARPELCLAGHTHGGCQFFLFAPFVKFAYPLTNGLYRNAYGSPTTVYTSPGTGIWGPPVKQYGRSLVTNIDLVPSK